MKINSLPTIKLAVSTAEAARATQFHQNTLRNWAHSGKGPIKPCGKRGNGYLWLAADVKALAKALFLSEGSAA